MLRPLIATLAIALVASSAPAISAQAADIHPALAGAVTARSGLVPQVVGWSAADAITALRSHGFGYSFKAPAGHAVKTPAHWTVTRQSPKAKTHAARGTKVVLTVVLTSVYESRAIRSFYVSDYGTLPTISEAGSGSATISLPAGIQAVLVKATYAGGGTFRLVELGKGGVTTKRVLATATGSYRGALAVGLTKVAVPTTAIRVTGSGGWNITITPISKAAILTMPATGTGDRVYLYSGPSIIRTASSPGPTSFMLNQISSSSAPNQAIDESGNWTGQIVLQAGPSVIEIHSTGSWTID